MVRLNSIKLNTLRLNAVPLNGVSQVQSGSATGGGGITPLPPSIPDEPEPPVEPDVKTYTLSASVSNGVVSATLNGSAISLPYEANEGDVIVVSVAPNDGFSFEGWLDGNTDNPRSITMASDVVLSAECIAVVAPNKHIVFEDAEVERVLMSKGVSSDGVGITKADAERVTSLSSWFNGNTSIKTFGELRYFANVKSFGLNSFGNCTSLERVDLCNATTIEGGAFSGCTKLASVGSLENVITIGNAAFRYCSSLAIEVDCPNLQTITGNYQLQGAGIVAIKNLGTAKQTTFATFNDCKALKYADLPSSITEIGTSTFNGCTALERIICRATTPPTLAHTNAFNNTNNCPIYVPDASLEAYKTATNWNQYASRIKGISEYNG